MEKISPCPNCEGKNLYRSKAVLAGHVGHSPNFLPGLGSFLIAERFHLVACKDCGLTRFFARPQATAKLPDSKAWTRV